MVLIVTVYSASVYGTLISREDIKLPPKLRSVLSNGNA